MTEGKKEKMRLKNKLKSFNFSKTCQENVARTKVQVALGLLVVMAFCLLMIPFAPDRQLMPESALTTTQNFKNASSESLTLLSQTFDEKKGLMKLEVQASDGLEMDTLKHQFFQKNGSGSSMQFIPTVDGKATLFIKQLDKNFGVLALSFQNQKQSNQIVNTTIFEDKQAAKAAESANQGKDSSNDDTVYFFITDNSKKLKRVSGKIKIESQKSYALGALNDEIAFQEKQKTKMKDAKVKLKKIIEQDQKEIDRLNDSKKYQAGDTLEKTNQQIQTLQTDQTQNQESIQTSDKNIQTIDEKIKKMNQEMSDISTGKYKFSEDESVKKLK